MLIIPLLTKTNQTSVFGEVFDNVFSNTSVYSTHTGYTTRSTASRYNFLYSGTQISVRGHRDYVLNSINHLCVFVNDNHYTDIPITDDSYHVVTLPEGINKKITILSGIIVEIPYTNPIQGTFLTGLNVDTSKYSKIPNSFNNTELVFLGDSITCGMTATSMSEGYANLFYRVNKLSTTILGWGNGALADMASSTARVQETVNRITSSLGTATIKKLVIALGANDGFRPDLQPCMPYFINYLRNLITAIKLADSSIQIWVNEPLLVLGEANQLQPLRDGITSLSQELNSFTRIPCKNCVPISTGYTSDKVHPNTVGHLAYHDFVAPYIL